MSHHLALPCHLALGFLLLLAAPMAHAQSGRIFEVQYEPSDRAGELPYGVTYTVWIPEGAPQLRGVIVHQHGCGAGACRAGATAAHDLHWQALAAKWQCALLGPSYHQADGQDCRQWCDPRNGSSKTFLKALDDLAAQSQHPELAVVPWCLWGHSGGGFWSSLMQTMAPERIVAIWFQSGTAYAAWEKGEIDKPAIPAAAYEVPIMLNAGAKEQGHAQFNGAWEGALAMFRAYRGQGAPAGFAPDPRTSHECGDSRYLAIPFFDACLAMRLPDVESGKQALKPVDFQAAHLAPLLGDEAVPSDQYPGEPLEAVWLPNRSVAHAWEQFVQSGATEDRTPPPAPFDLRAQRLAAGGLELTWRCAADFESGLRQFVILRNGQEIARVPEKPAGKFGRPLFQTMSYHDTPEEPLPGMRFVDAAPMAAAEYAVFAINSVELSSAPSPAVAAP